MSQASAADATHSQLRARLRAAAFTVLLLLMVAGPLGRQVLGVRSPLLLGWTMFSGRGLGDLDVDFFQVRAGARTSLPWGAMLYDGERHERSRREVRHWRMPRAKVVHTDADLIALARELCKLLPEGAELHARTRKAVAHGWTESRAIDYDLCSREGRRRLSREERARKRARQRAREGAGLLPRLDRPPPGDPGPLVPRRERTQ